MLVNKDFAEQFVQNWVASWNAKDLIACGAWLDDHVESISSNIALWFPESKGKIEGKNSLLKYFELVLDKIPNFTLSNPTYEIIGNTIMLSTLNDANKEIAFIGYSFSEQGKIIKIKASLGS